MGCGARGDFPGTARAEQQRAPRGPRNIRRMTDRLLTFYGDDFTGSTDALEAVASNGIPAVLFPDPPNDELLAKFSRCRAIGIAGESRSRGPVWMDEHLPPLFESLK